MRRRLLVAALALGLAACAAPGPDARREAVVRSLEGRWQLVSEVSNGKSLPEDFVRRVNVSIRDGHHSVIIDGKTVLHEIPFEFDAAADPMTSIDRLPDGREILGIFRVDGDALVSCVGAPGRPRPTDFTAPAGSGQVLRVFRRLPPA
ncbi:MAG TPA: TIGR03067 domain-containing protein [Burkholderiaceae bacterium]|jgi:uncharacterized protein (TIGR03067 family)|nr:TIGR03067 domain-containing protein [Burkholderiaceae bacterium]HPE01813.1 TIGR03067 domain-containing protein [Burkholderiaceae bacterium]